MTAEQICYFGYGSLVNERTLPKETTVIAGTLRGWVREWRGCSRWRDGSVDETSGLCVLTVRREPASLIKGAMVLDVAANLPKLDEREWHYSRIALNHGDFRADSAENIPQGSFLYEVTDPYYEWGNDEFPVLLSYVDCVLAGFYRLWGESGLEHFMETTLGWDHVPVLNDRAAPLYPRAQVLSPELQQRIDWHLEKNSVRVIHR
ncbi:gamma-glutamylcyclotransferase family protein [Flexibacterium corallicola]|uniref:gamma-glutamylcyclotransferase family protein n=1 Tax=Flexibacterium corallicola TaxID=3037259 RepID=UPI00286ED85D|nr:gamma-glutamylcyclotransferase family protein [Pseudovibrio sp. M1P-2-3]